METLGIHHLGLNVSDLNATTAFFVDCLGWSLIKEVPDYPSNFVSNGEAFSLFGRRPQMQVNLTEKVRWVCTMLLFEYPMNKRSRKSSIVSQTIPVCPLNSHHFRRTFRRFTSRAGNARKPGLGASSWQ